MSIFEGKGELSGIVKSLSIEVGLGGETKKTLSSSLVTSLFVEWGLGESWAMSASVQGCLGEGSSVVSVLVSCLFTSDRAGWCC